MEDLLLVIIDQLHVITKGVQLEFLLRQNHACDLCNHRHAILFRNISSAGSLAGAVGTNEIDFHCTSEISFLNSSAVISTALVIFLRGSERSLAEIVITILPGLSDLATSTKLLSSNTCFISLAS